MTERTTRSRLPFAALTIAMAAGLAALATGTNCSQQRWDLEVTLPSATGGAGGKGGATGGGRGGREGPGPGSGGSTGPDGGKDCSTWTQLIQRGKPRVLLLVDRSSNTATMHAGGENEMPWWKAVNDALGGVISSFGNTMNIGYRPFPTGAACMLSSEPWNSWDADVGAQIAACASGNCVSSSSEVPLVSALSDARKNFWPPGTQPDPVSFMVILLGSNPTCISPCQSNPNPLVSLALAGIEPLFNPFGNGIDGNQCLAFNTLPARNGRELSMDLMAQFKDIAAQAFCSFQLITAPGVTFNTLRVVVNNATFDLQRDNEKGWNFERNDVRVFGQACRAIVEAASTIKPTITATALDPTCRH